MLWPRRQHLLTIHFGKGKQYKTDVAYGGNNGDVEPLTPLEIERSVQRNDPMMRGIDGKESESIFLRFLLVRVNNGVLNEAIDPWVNVMGSNAPKDRRPHWCWLCA